MSSRTHLIWQPNDVYCGPRFVKDDRSIAMITWRRGTCSRRIKRSSPLQMKYPPSSYTSSPQRTRSSSVMRLRWQCDDPTMIGNWPRRRSVTTTSPSFT